MEQKSDRRVQYTKHFLKEALLGLMREKPIAQITPTELCRKADINRNTFYAHYTAPIDLLREIEGELYEDIMSCISVYFENTLKLDDLCRAIKEHADLCSVILSDHGDSEFLLNLILSAHDMTISEWKRRSPEAKDSDINSFFTYCANGSVGVIRAWVNEGMTYSPEQVAHVLETANSAVLTAFNRKYETENRTAEGVFPCGNNT